MQRREVYYRGTVQGVGFRYTARRIASHYRVTGYVKNLPDGRVLIVVEGEPGEVAGFLADVAETMGSCIRGTEEKILPATGEFQRFEIRF